MVTPRRIRTRAQAAILSCVAMCLVQEVSGQASSFVNIGGTRIHYLDFGGNGLPVLFLHSGNLSAATYANFAPRFTDAYRVIAMTERGVAPSEGQRAGPVPRARDALALLDSLRVQRAVVIGNSSPTQVMLYLAEHHSTRLAGLVFLANAPEPQLRGADDPLRINEMGMRMMASVQGLDPDRYLAQAESLSYSPEYLRTGRSIPVPALTFVNSVGEKGVQNLGDLWLDFATKAAREQMSIPDSVARTYFVRLGREPERQEEVRAYFRNTVVPAWRASERAFYTAFGERIRIARLERPVVSGYEYRDAPDVIYPHIRSFLDEIRLPSRTR